MSMMKMFGAVTLTAAALAALAPTDASARSFAAVTHVGQVGHGAGSVGWRRSTRSSRNLFGARLRAIHDRYRRPLAHGRSALHIVPGCRFGHPCPPQGGWCRSHPQSPSCRIQPPVHTGGIVGPTVPVDATPATPTTPTTTTNIVPPSSRVAQTPPRRKVEDGGGVVPGWYDCTKVPVGTPPNQYLGSSACPYQNGEPPPDYTCGSVVVQWGRPPSPHNVLVCRQAPSLPNGGGGGGPPGAPCAGNEQREASGLCVRPKPNLQ